MTKMMTQDKVSLELCGVVSRVGDARQGPEFGLRVKGGHLRGLAQAHGAVGAAHDLVAGAVHELRQPADAAHEEAGVDVEEDDGGVAVGVPPVGDERGLEEEGKKKKKIIKKNKKGHLGGQPHFLGTPPRGSPG